LTPSPSFLAATRIYVELYKEVYCREIMAPTIHREKGYRFFFFSREESRMHLHVYCVDGEAKFWLEPRLELARNYRLSRSQIAEAEEIIEANYNEFKSTWQRHFSG